MRKPALRRCAGCRNMQDKRQLVRVVRSPEGDFAVDITGKASGRGAYICRTPDCLEQAKKTKGLERSFKCALPLEIYEKLAKEFEV